MKIEHKFTPPPRKKIERKKERKEDIEIGRA